MMLIWGNSEPEVKIKEETKQGRDSISDINAVALDEATYGVSGFKLFI